MIEKDAALARRFQPVTVPEPSVAASITILRGLKDKYQAHHGVFITDAALVAAVQHAHRCMPGRSTTTLGHVPCPPHPTTLDATSQVHYGP